MAWKVPAGGPWSQKSSPASSPLAGKGKAVLRTPATAQKRKTPEDSPSAPPQKKARIASPTSLEAKFQQVRKYMEEMMASGSSPAVKVRITSCMNIS